MYVVGQFTSDDGKVITIKRTYYNCNNGIKRSTPNLSSDEWDVVEDCIPLLKSFHSITTELSVEEYPTISKVILLIPGSISNE